MRLGFLFGWGSAVYWFYEDALHIYRSEPTKQSKNLYRQSAVLEIGQ